MISVSARAARFCERNGIANQQAVTSVYQAFKSAHDKARAEYDPGIVPKDDGRPISLQEFTHRAVSRVALDVLRQRAKFAEDLRIVATQAVEEFRRSA